MELLAPAGGIGTALSAFDAGADAVYLGMSKFNARERTENFTFDQLSRLLAYAHGLGKKVHVAVNTLVKETELAEVMELLDPLCALAPDAVIVQDLGVLRLLREYFPGIPVHASTQMGIHNSAGVEFAASLGVSRVILERQITLTELAAIRRRCRIELEVFGHGALCCGLSGGCLFSSYLGGASGNRGKCKQPCRRFYSGAGREGYLFSPADLNTLALLPELVKIGVDSLKIEGRLKKADYVANVVAAYRLALDNPGDPAATAEAARMLERTAGRRASAGFYAGKPSAIVVPDSPGVWGFPVGTVIRVSEGAVTAKLSGRLHRGDRLRLLSRYEEDGPAITAAALFVSGKPVSAARGGEICTIKCDSSEASRGDVLCKIGECVRDQSGRAGALPLQRQPIDLDIRVRASGISVECAGLRWEMPLDLAEASSRALTADEITAVFAETASERFSLGKCKVEIDGRLFFPASLRKEARRAFYRFAEDNLPAGSDGKALSRFYFDYCGIVPAPACSEVTVLGRDNVFLLSQFCPEPELPALEDRIRRALAGGTLIFLAANVYGVQLMKRFPQAEVRAVFPLPAANSQAVILLRDNGVGMAELWPELDRKAAESLAAHAVLPLQRHVSGALELLETRAGLSVSGVVADRRGNRFRVVPGAVSKIVTVDSICLPGPASTGEIRDERYPAEEKTSAFNWDADWL
ncbi:MAG: U32 family peptidase [Victivallaceae bacterium]|nr:DUF3656 domain-containing protein [Victivallaceae bacterium]